MNTVKQVIRNKKIKIQAINIQKDEVYKMIAKFESKFPESKEAYSVIRQLIKRSQEPIVYKESDNGKSLPVITTWITPSECIVLGKDRKNRNDIKSHIKDLSIRVNENSYVDYGDHIEFTELGHQRNGTHRFEACIKSGKKIPISLMLGVSLIDTGRDENVKVRQPIENAEILSQHWNGKLHVLEGRSKGKVKAMLNQLLQESKGKPISRSFSKIGLKASDFLDFSEKYYDPIDKVTDIFFSGKRQIPGLTKLGLAHAFVKCLIKYPNKEQKILMGAKLILDRPEDIETTKEERQKPENSTIVYYLKQLMLEFAGKGGNQVDTYDQYRIACYFLIKWLKGSKPVKRSRRVMDYDKAADLLSINGKNKE